MAKYLKENKRICIYPRKLKRIKLVAEYKANENHVIVDAASILAKQASDKQYAEFKKIYGNFRNRSSADPATRRFVFDNHFNPPLITRTTWKTYKTLSRVSCLSEDPTRFCRHFRSAN